MTFYETWTSRRLEGYARARGFDYGIAYTPGNSTGAYHVISIDGQPLSRWQALGWSRDEAESTIDYREADND